MNTDDFATIEAWIAKQIADLCEMVRDDGVIIEIATAASDLLKGRREHGN